MGRVATARLESLVPDDLLVGLTRAMLGARPGFVRADAPRDEDETELFTNWDARRGHGVGYFSGDRDECRSRRVDLRGPTDLDPGPLAMEEAPDDLQP